MIAIPIVADTACDKMKKWENFESEGFLFRVIGFRFENFQVVLENIWVTIDYFPVKHVKQAVKSLKNITSIIKIVKRFSKQSILFSCRKRF